MSGNKQGKTWLGRGFDVFSLGVVFAIVYTATRWAPDLGGEASLLGSLGFLLLAGTLMSELVEVLGVPHLTGYLFAGVLAGPHVLQFVDLETVKRLEPVNTLAIALIALAGGAELRIDHLKQGLKSLTISTVFQSGLGVVLVGGVFFVVRPAFVREMPASGVLAVALLWGVLAISRSPSALLGVLSQTRATGPLARFALQFVMTSDIVVIVALAAAITVARPLLDPGATISADAFKALGHELLGSIALGTTLGLLLAAYVKLVGRQLLVVLVALGFGATEVLQYLNVEPLLTFMVAGFVVQNLSNQGQRFLHAIEETGGIVYVIFFAGAGAALDLPLLRDYWKVALVLTGARFAVTFGVHTVASRLARDVPSVRAWGWTPLIAQAGVANGIALIAARSFPSFGKEFASISLACVALNAIIGPVVFKFALDRVDETRPPSASLTDPAEAGAAPEPA